MNSLNVMQLLKSQVANASEIAAKAFADDPVFCYLTSNNPKRRSKALTWLTSRAIAYCTQYNHVYTTSDLQGVAAWIPPGEFSSNPFQLLQMALQLRLYALPFNVGWNRLGRWLNFLSETEQAHQQDMGNQPHWYLGILIVNPVCQSQGVGSRLIQPILQRASEEGLVCYVVTFAEQAVRFYQKNGFGIIRNQKPAPDVPPFWTLKRNP